MGFTIGSALGFGWETFKKRPWFFIVAAFLILLAPGLISVLTDEIDSLLAGTIETPAIITLPVDLALNTLISMGSTAFYLAAHDNPETVEVSALWHPHPFWNYFAAFILVLVVTMIGFVLLIVPGVILMLMFIFAPYVVIDCERGPIDAMGESNRITRGHKWSLFGLGLVIGLTFIMGIVALVLSIGITAPYSYDPITVGKLLGAAPLIDLLAGLALIFGLAAWASITGLALTHAYRVLSGGAVPRPADAALAV
jgi:uncharacterized membrane protein